MRLSYDKRSGQLLHGEKLIGFINFVKPREPLLKFHFSWSKLRTVRTTYHSLFVMFSNSGSMHIYVEH